MLRKLFGVMCVGVGAAVALTGCGPDDHGEECFTDEECQITELCYGEDGADSHEPLTCVPLCEDDEDCQADETCAVRDDGSEAGPDDTICLPADDVDACSSDDDCDEGEVCEFGDDGGQDDGQQDDGQQDQGQQDQGQQDEDEDNGEAQGTCVPEPTAVADTVQITDVGDYAGDTTYGYDTAGGAFYEIALLDDDGVVAHATAVDFHIGADNNFNVEDDASFIFDGSDPGFADACPTMDDDFQNEGGADRESNFTYNQVLVLGDGGELYVQFFDGDDPIELTPNHSVEIFSYGETCGFVHADESWGADTHGWSDCSDVQQTADEEDWTPFCPRTAYFDYDVGVCAEDDCDSLGTGHGHVEVFDIE